MRKKKRNILKEIQNRKEIVVDFKLKELKNKLLQMDTRIRLIKNKFS